MVSEILYPLEGGDFRWNGYIEQLISYYENDHLCDEEVWSLFVDQFRRETDGDGRWRGEYWGKAMRGGVMVYRCTKNRKVYDALKQAVLELLSTQEESGRISSYPQDRELFGWDMWARKYVLLGCLYFYDICEEADLKKQILAALEKHLDYIVEKIGPGEGQKSIFQTSEYWNALNSCSILEPVVKMYKQTQKKSYLQFAQYITDSGFSENESYIGLCLTKEKHPWQFEITKAYEMMSCFQGLLELYTVTEEARLLTAVVNFADLLEESDITIIGCAGCKGEFLDHAAVTQTEFTEEEMQETCVTVTWMNLCYRLLQITGNAKYADWLERSALNAMNGSVNVENQRALRADNMDYNVVPPQRYEGRRRILPFDSYSPLVCSRRGKFIGGFNIMDHEEIYGCCACIGGLGLAIEELFGVMKMKSGFVVNLYGNAEIHSEYHGKPVDITLKTDWNRTPGTVIEVRAKERFVLALRIPYWTGSWEVRVNGKKATAKREDGYLYLEEDWGTDQIEVYYDSELRTVSLNGKIAFCKGGYVLARTEEVGENIHRPIGNVQSVAVPDEKPMDCEIALKVQTDTGEIFLCDYAHAGKKYDAAHCDITVWSTVDCL